MIARVSANTVTYKRNMFTFVNIQTQTSSTLYCMSRFCASELKKIIKMHTQAGTAHTHTHTQMCSHTHCTHSHTHSHSRSAYPWLNLSLITKFQRRNYFSLLPFALFTVTKKFHTLGKWTQAWSNPISRQAKLFSFICYMCINYYFDLTPFQ